MLGEMLKRTFKIAVVVAAAMGVALFAEAAPPPPADAGLAGPKADVSPPALEDVEHMCALLTSCEGVAIPSSMIPRDFGACVKTMSHEMTSPSAVNFSLTIRECGLRANSCGALRTCALRGAKPETCVGRGKSGSAGFCDADGRAISCFHEKVMAVRDCPRGGEQCAVREGESLCTLGACPPDMKEVTATCSTSGTRILRCEKGKLASLDCGAFGLKCVTTPDGAGCATANRPCTPDKRVCEGSNALGCYNGREVRLDCAAANLSCHVGPDAIAIGACSAPAPAPADRCNPSAPAKCEGASVSYCLGGKSRSYFCKALGFSKCINDASGARCAN